MNKKSGVGKRLGFPGRDTKHKSIMLFDGTSVIEKARLIINKFRKKRSLFWKDFRDFTKELSIKSVEFFFSHCNLLSMNFNTEYTPVSHPKGSSGADNYEVVDKGVVLKEVNGRRDRGEGRRIRRWWQGFSLPRSLEYREKHFYIENNSNYYREIILVISIE